MQMGRLASAHNWQSTSQLIVAVMNEEASAKTARLMAHGALHPSKSRWIQLRTERLGQQQAAVAMMQVFQDYLLEVAVEKYMKEVVDQVEAGTLRGELQVCLSPKPEANRPFGTKFEFIGAECDTSDLEQVRRHPADHIFERIREQLPICLERWPELMDLAVAQELIWRVAFCAMVLVRGRAPLNSSYACLPAAEHMQLHRR